MFSRFKIFKTNQDWWSAQKFYPYSQIVILQHPISNFPNEESHTVYHPLHSSISLNTNRRKEKLSFGQNYRYVSIWNHFWAFLYSHFQNMPFILSLLLHLRENVVKTWTERKTSVCYWSDLFTSPCHQNNLY